jgi:hypothetical protein
VRACVISWFLFVFGSVDFFLIPLPLFVLVLLVFAFAVVRLVSDERLSVFQAWRGFCRCLYIRDVYVSSYSSPRSNSHSLLHSWDIASGPRPSWYTPVYTDTSRYPSTPVLSRLDTSLSISSCPFLTLCCVVPPRQALYLNISRTMSASLETRMVNTSRRTTAASLTPSGARAAKNPFVEAWHHLEQLLVDPGAPAPNTRPFTGTPPELHVPKSCTKRAGKQYANAQITAFPPAPTTTVASPAATPAVASTTSVPDAV